jgi:hypothetical protein
MQSKKKAKSMLVILTDRQILSTKQVCSGCLMADSGGLPRWQQGKLCCGHLVAIQNHNVELDVELSNCNRPKIYECQMGFRVTDIE